MNCARYGTELYSINELHDLDLYPWESRCSGPELRPFRRALKQEWDKFEEDLLFGPKGMGKGCRAYFPESVCEHVANGTKKADKVLGMSYRQKTYGGAYKRFRGEYVSLDDLTVLLPYNTPIDCIPTKYEAATVEVASRYGGGTVYGPTVCANKPRVGTSPIWMSRVCLKSEVADSGSLDRVIPDERGQYVLPEIGYVVSVRQDANGRYTVSV